MKDTTHENPRIVAAAERQMRAWELAQSTPRADSTARRTPVPQIGPYVSISREHGAGGSAIGELLGQRLGWEVLDKNLLDRVAKRSHVSRQLLELVDETAANWAYDVLGTWLDRGLVPHEKYVTQLCHVVLAAGRRGNVIFVGRGVPFVLPREAGVSVRIIAPLKHRIAQVVKDEKLTRADARAAIERIDKGRRRFVERYFHYDITDPHYYDLIINTAQLGVEAAVELIITAINGKGLQTKLAMAT